ncbi:MAG: cupin domain-containing protein [Halobacteriales archaeon]|nr:cupin domain-containing protein [Halobacteriales archaeon]
MYTKTTYTDVEPVADSMYFLRDALDCAELGMTVVDCPPGWTGKAHDHADDGQEEVYYLVDGEATITVEDEPVELSGGDAVRVAAEATRQIENGDRESQFVIVGAP